MQRGIYHLALGRDRGLIKNMTFAKEDSPQLRAFRMMATYKQIQQLRFPYNSTISMIGNAYFHPGQDIFINPSLPGMGSATNPASAASQLGLGGYYQILQVDHSISNGKYETTANARYIKPPTLCPDTPSIGSLDAKYAAAVGKIKKVYAAEVKKANTDKPGSNPRGGGQTKKIPPWYEGGNASTKPVAHSYNTTRAGQPAPAMVPEPPIVPRSYCLGDPDEIGACTVSAPQYPSNCTGVALDIAEIISLYLEGGDKVRYKNDLVAAGVKVDGDKVEDYGIIERRSEGAGDHWTDKVRSYTVVTKFAPERRSYAYHFIESPGNDTDGPGWYLYNFSLYL